MLGILRACGCFAGRPHARLCAFTGVPPVDQVLHYKLYHDSWRRNKEDVHHRATGMPDQCSS